MNLETLYDTIAAWYDPTQHHFITINALMYDENTVEIQWYFSILGTREELIHFTLHAPITATIPTMAPLIPAASLYEQELYDLLGIHFTNATRGLFLDHHSTPLRIQA